MLQATTDRRMSEAARAAELGVALRLPVADLIAWAFALADLSLAHGQIYFTSRIVGKA